MFIIQIGACDGKTDVHRNIDEIWTGVTQHGWHGILLEPNPRHFQQLQDTYRNYLSRVELLNIAINKDGGTADFYDCAIHGNSSLKENIVIKNSNDYKKITVRCITINNLLCGAKIKNGLPNYLVIDAEGSDGDIIEDLDIKRFPIPKIRFEFAHMEMEQLGRVCLKLIKHDYTLTHSKADIIAEQ
jgi:FkbM family methyltransferase